MGMTYEDLAEMAKGMAESVGEWAGIPLPVDGVPLVVEDKYPFKGIEKIANETLPPRDDDMECINSWYSYRLHGQVLVGRNNKGISEAVLRPWNGGQMLIGTMMASVVWPLKAERKAIDKLATLLSPHMFEAYLTMGTFLETSKRSGITYCFRKLRPTVAIKPDDYGQLKMLCTLCLHPIAYYKGTWAGSMVPTDDVIAHLLLMRGDEHHYWKMANQHSPASPQSGL